MTGYKTKNKPVSILAFSGLGVFFCLSFYSFVILPSSTMLIEGPHHVVDAPPIKYSPPVIRPPSAINPHLVGSTHIDTPTTNSTGVFKCVNAGHVTYATVPCASGAVAYQSDLITVTHADLVTVTHASPVRSVSLMRGGNGVYNLSGKVDSYPVDFILDTGASKTTISGTTAYQMGIHSCDITSNTSTANGMAGNCSMTVARLSVGDFIFTNVSVNIAPTMQGNSLIGNDLLSELKVEQHGGVMTLSK
jgi:aspartyl protease family protein